MSPRHLWYTGCLISLGVERIAQLKTSPNGEAEIFFECEHCGVPLVVAAQAAGMALQCQACSKSVSVPIPAPPAKAEGKSGNSGERLAELRRHLKENESQTVEIKGQINQLSIQLHRWQLRLQTLEQRRQELTSELAAALQK